MSDTKQGQSEETSKEGEGFQETFMSHLFELRDRVVKSAIAVIWFLFHWSIGLQTSFTSLQSHSWIRCQLVAR